MPSGVRRTQEPDHGLVAMLRQGTFKERGSSNRSERSPQSLIVDKPAGLSYHNSLFMLKLKNMADTN